MKEIKIVLLNVQKKPSEYWGYYPPLGILSLASYLLKKEAIKKKNLLVLESSFPYYLQWIKQFRPDVVAFSFFTSASAEAIKVAKKIRKFSDGLFILGGVHTSLFPQQLVSPFQIGVIGEGEETFYQLLMRFKRVVLRNRNFDLFEECKDIKSLVILKEDGEKVVTRRKEEISPLDKIPPLDWSLLPDVYFRYEMVKDIKGGWKAKKVMPIFTSRGCPYNCAFCARKALWKNVRFFSPQHVVREIKTLVEKYKIEAIQIWDDVFALSKERVGKISKALEKEGLLEKVIFFRAFARADILNEELVLALKKLGVKSLAFGFESGSNKILTHLKGAGATVEKNWRAIKLCQKHDLGMVACLMIGVPNETIEDMKKTVKFVQKLAEIKNVEVLEINRATPFPGTKFWDYAQSRGLISYDDWDNVALTDSKEHRHPLLVTDKKAFKFYTYVWNKMKTLEKQVEKRNRGETGWRKEFKIMQKRMKLKRERLITDLILRDFLGGRILLGVKMSLIILLDKIKWKISEVKHG